MPNIEQHTVPVLYTTRVAGAPRPWLMSEHQAFFSLANLGSYHQRHFNQLLSVCSELSHHVSFLPILSLPSLRDMERRETIYANGQPFVHTATLEGVDIYDRQPSAAETTLVSEMLATIQYYQAVPVLSYSIIISMLRRCMDEAARDQRIPYNPVRLCQEPQAEEYKAAPLRLGQLQRYLNAAEQLGALPLIYTGLPQLQDHRQSTGHE